MTAEADEPASTLRRASGLACEALADDLVEGVVLLDGAQRLLYANRGARGLLGVTEASIGRRLAEIVRDYRITLIAHACSQSLEVVERELGDLGSTYHLVVRAIPVAHDGARHIAMLFRDESRLRHLETVRRDFVANVSHELRTPVAAIQLLVETLQNGGLEDAATAAEFVGRIGLEVTHMRQMVAELLELSAIESAAQPIRTAPVDVTELMAAAERLRPLAEERRVALGYRLDPATPPIMGDRERLAQVVRNLVHNAIKFTPAEGSIDVSARQVALPSGDPGVELRVADTGPGLTAAEAARIFERFYKADRSRQRDGEGTGLGLAIARHVVEIHGGTIGVESEPGRGATFVVVLPGAIAPPQTPPRVEADLSAEAGARGGAPVADPRPVAAGPDAVAAGPDAVAAGPPITADPGHEAPGPDGGRLV